MGKFRPAAEQAKHLVMKKTQHGVSRHRNPDLAPDVIVSVGSEIKHRGNTKRIITWLISKKISPDKITHDSAHEFLREVASRTKQSTADGYRRTLAIVFGLHLPLADAVIPTLLEPRAYRPDQVDLLCKRAKPSLTLSIRIAAHAGLRAEELLTIGRADEQPESVRPWLKERFSGRADELEYTVDGKGGLCRKVLLTEQLACELEATRQAPSHVRDRGVNHLPRYSIIGGQKFSDQITRLCNRTLGWSCGAHGLRHTFAHRRLRELLAKGYVFQFALNILAQEMGHFSTDNTMKYMR